MSDRSRDQVFFDLTNTITAHIDSGALEVEEVREAVAEGIANSVAGEPTGPLPTKAPKAKRPKKPGKESGS